MIKKLLIEEITKDDEKIIDNMIKDRIESGDTEDVIKDVTVDVIEQLFRTLWQRRGTWRGGLK